MISCDQFNSFTPNIVFFALQKFKKIKIKLGLNGKSFLFTDLVLIKYIPLKERQKTNKYKNILEKRLKEG